MIILVYFILTLFSCFMFMQGSESSSDYCLAFVRHDDPALQVQACDQLPDLLTIRSIKFTSPQLITPAEKASIAVMLTGCVYKNNLILAVELLKRKNIFGSITLKILSIEENVYDIIIETRLFLAVSEVAIHGFLLGKERLISLYGLRSGDEFSLIKHRDGINQITQWFNSQGYFAVQITDKLTFGSDESVCIDLSIRTGKQYSIKGVNVALSGDLTSECIQPLKQKLEKFLRRKLHRSYYSQSRVDEQILAIKNYLNKQGYVYLHIHCKAEPNSDTHTLFLLFEIAVHQKKRFELLGCSEVHRTALQESLHSFNAIASIIPLDILTEEMIRCYKSWGYTGTKIAFSEEKDVIYFVFDEGLPLQFRVNTIEFEPDFANEYKHIFTDYISQSSISHQTYRQLKLEILQRLRDLGFWDARVVTGAETSANNIHDVTLKIVAGQQRIINSISFTHFKDLATHDYFSSINHESTIPLSMHMLQEQAKYIDTYLQQKGYLYAKAKPVLISQENCTMLEWTFEGVTEPIRFGKVFIEGRQTCVEQCIRHELLFKENDLWNPGLLYGSYQKLMALDIFDDVSIQPVYDATQCLNKHCSIKYTLAKPFEARIRGGLLLVGQNLEYTTATAKLGGNFHWRNVSNRSDHLTINADYSRYKRDVVLRYYQPWFMDWPVQHSYELYSTRYSQALTPGSKFNLYDLYQNGALSALKIVRENWNVGIDVGFETMQLECISYELAQKINFEPRLVGVQVPYVFSEATLFGQQLDNKINPHNGYYGLLTAKAMCPVSLKDGAFLRLLGEAALFIPLGSWTLALRGRMGHIFYQTFPRIMPSERFYLGGAFSLRGYMTDLVPPVNYVDKTGCPFPVPVGGKSMINTNIELRIPLARILSGALFTDIGLLSPTAWYQMRISDIHAGSGFGLRIETPVGPLRFDVARKWRADVLGQGLWRWYITLGYPF